MGWNSSLFLYHWLIFFSILGVWLSSWKVLHSPSRHDWFGSNLHISKTMLKWLVTRNSGGLDGLSDYPKSNRNSVPEISKNFGLNLTPIKHDPQFETIERPAPDMVDGAELLPAHLANSRSGFCMPDREALRHLSGPEVAHISKGSRLAGALVTDDPLATISGHRKKGSPEKIYAVSRWGKIEGIKWWNNIVSILYFKYQIQISRSNIFLQNSSYYPLDV